MAQNVQMQFDAEEEELVIRIDTSADLGKSKSGKTRIVATTRGNTNLGLLNSKLEGVMLGVNCYKYD